MAAATTTPLSFCASSDEWREKELDGASREFSLLQHRVATMGNGFSIPSLVAVS
jgi:hypothetical protein